MTSIYGGQLGKTMRYLGQKTHSLWILVSCFSFLSLLMIQKVPTKRWALIYSGPIFPKDALSLASENGMFCFWEWNVLTQVCVGPGIHALGWRQDMVEGILFWDWQESRLNMAYKRMCTLQSSFSSLCFDLIIYTFNRHLRSTYCLTHKRLHTQTQKEL